jgi:hypothetical protein
MIIETKMAWDGFIRMIGLRITLKENMTQMNITRITQASMIMTRIIMIGTVMNGYSHDLGEPKHDVHHERDEHTRE